MNIDISCYLSILAKLKITPSQFLFCYLTHQRMFAEIHTYTKTSAGFSSEEIDDLVNRELVIDFNTDSRRFADAYIVDDKFIELVFNVDKISAGMLFWNSYPAVLSIEGKSFSGRNEDQDSFLVRYYDLIGHSPVKHSEVMRALDYAKKRNLINQGLKSWFASRQWETILQLMTTHAAPTDLPSQRIF